MKKLIIEMMLDFANNYNPKMLDELTQKQRIKVLNALIYVAIYQTASKKNEYEPQKIIEYFGLNEYDSKLFETYSWILKKHLIIDLEHDFVVELIHIDKTQRYIINVDKDDIGNSTIQFIDNGAVGGDAMDTPSISFSFKNKEQKIETKTEINPQKIVKQKTTITRKSVKKKNDFEIDF